jgi:hypothetical protein
LEGLLEPAQSLAQRQLPEGPFLHLGLLQHFTLAVSQGQAPLIKVPPVEVQ